MRASFVSFRLALPLVALVAGCFRGVYVDPDKIECSSTQNCPAHYTCMKAEGAELGKCVGEGRADTGVSSSAKPDGAVAEVASDSKRLSDAQASSETNSADASAGPDTPIAVVDAPAMPEDTGVAADAIIVVIDTAQDVPFSPGADAGDAANAGDTATPCNGGCCSNADCPAMAPVCNKANQCVGCITDVDCTGRSLSTCNQVNGACVQCTKKEQCSGANAACNLTTNACVGCTQRSDCPGACQTCSNQACVPVRNADDPSKCSGTCDATGECKAKKGQKCTSVAGGCLSGLKCAPDDTCCDRDCTGPCEACNLTTAPGTCTVLTAGSKPQNGHTPCVGTGTCGGSCQGAPDGTCTYPTDNCGVSSCTATTYQAIGKCHQGTCSMPGPVSCIAGATCSQGECSCPLGYSDCTTLCAKLESDPKNCGKCGHDCLGGPCEGGYCKPYKLADVATIGIDRLAVDGGRVYAFTLQTKFVPTTVWQMDASTPGEAVKVPPDQPNAPLCVIDGYLVWPEYPDASGSIVFGYCPVSGCLGATKKFSHSVPATGSTSTNGHYACDLAAKEIVWVESYYLDNRDNQTYSIWRSSPTGANLRQMTTFPVVTSSSITYSEDFPVGRADRLVYTLRGETTSQTFTVLTTTKNAVPTLLASGDTSGPSDLLFANIYGNDNLLVWTVGEVTYRAPLPNGVGSSTPPIFYDGKITSGIMDNHHFYGYVEKWPDVLYWCTPPTCSLAALANPSIQGMKYIQDAGALYWATMTPNAETFSIWKVAKQPY